MTRLAVFDCDGTLSDGQAAICGAMASAFEGAALPAPDMHAVRRIVGLSLPQAVARLLPDKADNTRAKVIDLYRQAFFDARAAGRSSEPLYDGIAGLLRALHTAGWTLGVATGKSDRGLQGLLQRNGLAPLFATLQTADRHPSKPDPAMLRAAMDEAGADIGETVMIGDTVFDMDMAGALGVRAIGVAWGYHTGEELLAAGAEAVAATPAELETLIDG